MSSAQILEQLRALPAEVRSVPVTQIWDEFTDFDVELPVSQAAELDRRLEDHRRNPHDVVTWSEIKDAAATKLTRKP